jgi:adenosylcobinamide-GDP ribazoletransferase
MHRALMWFPAVGLGLGGILMGIDWLLNAAFSPLLTSTMVVVALALLTGGLHLDGLADTCDAIGGGHTPNQRLDIMKDTNLGTFGAIGLFSALALKVFALASLGNGERSIALLTFPALSRWGMVVAIKAFPYARHKGSGLAFKQRATWPWLAVTTSLTGIIAVVLCGFAGLGLMAAAAALVLLVGGFLNRRQGGLTGDSFGTINEMAEVAVLLLFQLLGFWEPWL